MAMLFTFDGKRCAFIYAELSEKRLCFRIEASLNDAVEWQKRIGTDGSVLVDVTDYGTWYLGEMTCEGRSGRVNVTLTFRRPSELFTPPDSPASSGRSTEAPLPSGS